MKNKSDLGQAARWSRFSSIILLMSLGGSIVWGADTWFFSNEVELRQELPKQTQSARALYYIIVRARKRNLEAQTALALRDLLKKEPRNPRVQAAYAFSLFMAIDLWSVERHGQKAPPLMIKVRERQGDISYYQPKALTALPKSPAILLMAARSDFYSYGGTDKEGGEEQKKAIGLVRRALKEDPEWADLHYWLGRMLLDHNRSQGNHLNKARYVQEAIAAFQKVEKSKPSWRADCLRQYITAYHQLGQIGKTIEYLDAYARARPEFGKQAWVVKWRQSLVKQLQAKRT